jgi:hypothetical protein
MCPTSIAVPGRLVARPLLASNVIVRGSGDEVLYLDAVKL